MINDITQIPKEIIDHAKNRLEGMDGYLNLNFLEDDLAKRKVKQAELQKEIADIEKGIAERKTLAERMKKFLSDIGYQENNQE